jgi:hypothetical protein
MQGIALFPSVKLLINAGTCVSALRLLSCGIYLGPHGMAGCLRATRVGRYDGNISAIGVALEHSLVHGSYY